MPLTPEDVSNKRFTPVRLREGYDMGEVDQFLDEVESELARLNKENEDLRSKLAAGGGAPAAPAPKPSGETAAVPPAREEIKVTTAAEASTAAARLLELATKNADELVAEARQEADGIVGEARRNAERLESETKQRVEKLESETKTKTDRLEQDARQRAQMLDSETEAKRRELFGDLEKEKVRLDAEVDNLRSFEREYRSRLRTYFTQQLEALDNPGEEESSTALEDQPEQPKG
jgi:DivIVA domain-containing protein